MKGVEIDIPVELYEKIDTIAKRYNLTVDQYMEIYFLGVAFGLELYQKK